MTMVATARQFASLLCLIGSFFLLISPSSAQEKSSDGPVLTLKALDKITARTTVFEVNVGESVRFGTLDIRVRYCRTRPPEEPPETFAFIEINDHKRTGNTEQVFSGWMIASSPAWNALEHPVYDVWVTGCA